MQDAYGQNSVKLASHLEEVAAYLIRMHKFKRASTLLDHSLKIHIDAGASYATSSKSTLTILNCRLLRNRARSQQQQQKLPDASKEVSGIIQSITKLLAARGLILSPELAPVTSTELTLQPDSYPPQLHVTGVSTAFVFRNNSFLIMRKVFIRDQSIPKTFRLVLKTKSPGVSIESFPTCLSDRNTQVGSHLKNRSDK